MNSLNASTSGNISALAEKGAGCYQSLAWTPSGWAAKETQCSTASSPCLSDWHSQQPYESPLQPQPLSTESKKATSPHAALLPRCALAGCDPGGCPSAGPPDTYCRLRAYSWEQQQGRRDAESYQNLPPASALQKSGPDLLKLGALQGEIMADPKFSSSCLYVAEEEGFSQVLAPAPGAAAGGGSAHQIHLPN